MASTQNGVIDDVEIKRQRKQEIKKFLLWLVVAISLIILSIDDVIETAIGLIPPFCFADEVIAVIKTFMQGYKVFAVIFTFSGVKEYSGELYNKLGEVSPEAAETAKGITDAGLEVLEAQTVTKTLGTPGKSAEAASAVKDVAKETTVAAKAVQQAEVVDSMDLFN